MKDDNPIVIKHNFNAVRATVWKAITNVDDMRQWYFDNIPDFNPEVGFETRFLIQNEGRNFTHIWKVTEVIPLRKIGYTWNFEEYTGQGFSTFELTEEDSKTTLILKSYVLQDFPNDIPEFKRESGQAGWDYLIKKNLKSFLAKEE